MTPADYLTAILARFTDHPVVRRAAWLGFLSWVVALTLTGYIFGFTDGFFGRLFSATFVLWLLLLGTVFGIRPAINWLTRRLSDDGGGRAPRTKRAPRAAAKRGAASPTIPANKWR